MKKLKIAAPDFKKIEINGIVFDILKSDAEVLERAAELKSEYECLSDAKTKTNLDTAKIIKAVKAAIAFIDEMLGQGAARKITGGKPLNMVYSVNLMSMICRAVAEEYALDVAENYDIKPKKADNNE